MERLNSGDERIIFGTVLCTRNIGLMMYGRARWQEAEATIEDFNTELIRQDKKFFISELFKVVQDAVSLILLFRTMSFFWTVSSSSSFIMSDVQINVHSIINSGLVLGGQN